MKFNKTYREHIQSLLVENTKRQGIAIDIYLRRDRNYIQTKTKLFYDIKGYFIRDGSPGVVEFGDTLTNQSSVLELTIPFERYQLDQEIELLPNETEEDYRDILRSMGIEHFDIYVPN